MTNELPIEEMDDTTKERDAVEHVAAFVRARNAGNEADRTQKALRPVIDAWFKELAVGAELFDDERGVGLRKDAGSGGRFLDFEATPVDLLEWAAGAGLLSLNVGAYDGALKSSDLRVQHYAQMLALHVKEGRGTKLVTITERTR